MRWFGRRKGGEDDRPPGTYVASDLAEFLTDATEGMALSQAIEARVIARTQAEAERTEAQRGTDPHPVGTNELA